MNTPNITPGPWATSKDAVPDGHVQITVYDEPTGKRVATVFERPENAQAIAALPQLLAALAGILTLVDDCADLMATEVHPDRINSMCDEAQAALLAAGYTNGKDA